MKKTRQKKMRNLKQALKTVATVILTGVVLLLLARYFGDNMRRVLLRYNLFS